MMSLKRRQRGIVLLLQVGSLWTNFVPCYDAEYLIVKKGVASAETTPYSYYVVVD